MSQYLGGRRRSVRELVEHFEVSERTIYRDLNELESMRVPIVRDGRGVGLVEGGRVRHLPISPSEHALLRVALSAPALDRHPALARRVQVLLNKLDRSRGALPGEIRERRRAVAIESTDRSGRIDGPLFEGLEDAIRQRRAVEMLYASLSGGTRRWRGADPYRLFHRGDAWYLAARCHERDEIVFFRVDRIEEVRAIEEPVERPEGLDLEAMLEGTWTVYRGREELDVRLRFAPELGPLILRAEHHPGEVKEEADDGWIDYRVDLSSLEEIARWVVGFGGRVRVVAPEDLRRQAAEIARGALGALAGSGGDGSSS